MRIYALVASIDPLRIYLYDEGLARLATDAYQVPLAAVHMLAGGVCWPISTGGMCCAHVNGSLVLCPCQQGCAVTMSVGGLCLPSCTLVQSTWLFALWLNLLAPTTHIHTLPAALLRFAGMLFALSRAPRCLLRCPRFSGGALLAWGNVVLMLRRHQKGRPCARGEPQSPRPLYRLKLPSFATSQLARHGIPIQALFTPLCAPPIWAASQALPRFTMPPLPSHPHPPAGPHGGQPPLGHDAPHQLRH